MKPANSVMILKSYNFATPLVKEGLLDFCKKVISHPSGALLFKSNPQLFIQGLILIYMEDMKNKFQQFESCNEFRSEVWIHIRDNL